MKRILLSALVLVLIIGCLLTGASAAQNTKATLSNQTACRGDEVTLKVTLSGAVNAHKGFISINPGSDLEIVSGAWSVGSPLQQDFTAPDGEFLFETDTDIQGAIFSVTLKVSDTAPLGEIEIEMELKLYDSDDAEISCTSVPGTVTVLSCDHSFTKQVIEDEYKVSDADCENAAVYYYCCEICDEMGTTTFEYGTALGHTGGTATCIEKAICTRCEQPYGSYSSHKYSTLVPAVFEKHTQTELIASVIAHYRCTVCEKYFTTARVETTLEALTVVTPTHTYGDWKTDDDNHWKECVCGLKAEEEPHIYDDEDDLTCDTCQHNRTFPHIHSEITEQKGQAPSCNTNGWKDYYVCSCGSYFTDAECTNLIADLETWKNGEGKLAATHDYGTLVPAVPEIHTQTELAAGIAEYYQCAVCGKYFTSAKVETTFDKLRGTVPSHSYGAWESDEHSHWQSCSCGKKTEVVAHSGGEATCESKAKCSGCSAEYGTLGDHKYSTATCTAKAKCSICGTETGELAAHNDTNGDGKCDACQYQMSVPEPEKPKVGTETVVIIIGVAAAVGICMFVLFKFVFKKIA